METALWTFAVSGASALAFLAYKHPVSYVKFGWRLAGLLWVLGAITLIWKEGVKLGTNMMIEEFQLDTERAAQVLEPLLESSGNLSTVIGAVALYLMLLTFLPLVIDLDEPKRRE
ncbi:hypothetical protein [Aurantimonas endophytica]|uniref:Uncharacterized protein n=1 Tax=Aurantimonas endophytica TaxID=1522175 RepID=A0A7W6HER4_9HYPH|nr:hypothetical protein [Aurantimonas endophytica]MBB4003884.1 hypothetical protein [Aurantimonas endophytica]MCO6404735.1 hypothetical protein [Aurantimonas endophytica]